MSQKKSAITSAHVQWMCSLALLIAVEIVMKLIGLGMVPVGPLKMSFLTVPVAVGAIVLGPGAGAMMGLVFGLISLQDAISGASVMTNIFFQISPVKTVLLCVGTRVLMGFLTGIIFKLIKKTVTLKKEEGNKKKIAIYWYYITSLMASLLNTGLFMGFIATVFYKTDYVQNLVLSLGAANPFMFIILLVGFQGLVEAVACTVVAGSLGKALERFSR